MAEVTKEPQGEATQAQQIRKEQQQITKEPQIKAVTSCSTHKIDQQETDG